MGSIIDRLIDQEPGLTLSEQLDVVVAIADRFVDAAEDMLAYYTALLDKINWSDSFLDADMIFKMNTVPGVLQQVVKDTKGEE